MESRFRRSSTLLAGTDPLSALAPVSVVLVQLQSRPHPPQALKTRPIQINGTSNILQSTRQDRHKSRLGQVRSSFIFGLLRTTQKLELSIGCIGINSEIKTLKSIKKRMTAMMARTMICHTDLARFVVAINTKKRGDSRQETNNSSLMGTQNGLFKTFRDMGGLRVLALI